jgi:hypothetical protein
MNTQETNRIVNFGKAIKLATDRDVALNVREKALNSALHFSKTEEDLLKIKEIAEENSEIYKTVKSKINSLNKNREET